MGEDELGALLRRHRQDADLTIEDLAAASGVSDRGIGDIERGVSRGPQHRTVQALADALGLGADDRAVLVRAARAGRRRTAPSPAGAHALPLPRAVADFTGREVERAALAGALTADPPAAPVALVTGPPGFGKTTLAAQVARDLRGQFDDVLFLDLRGVDAEPVTPDAAVRRVAEALAAGTVPPEPDEAVDHLRGLLARRRVLLVLDNAASEDQIRPLLPADGPAAVLVTSRRALAGLSGLGRTVLGRLDPADSVALLARLAPGAPDELRRLASLCDDVPLALRIAGNRLATHAGWSIGGLVRRMSVEERRLDSLTAGDLQVRAAFASSYEQLGPGAQRLFRRLALVDAPHAGAGLAAALVGETLWRTEDLLDELTDLSLVQHLPGDRYQLHDLLRLFARGELDHQEDPAAHDATRAAADDWLLTTAVRAGRRFEPEHERDPDAGLPVPRGGDVDLHDADAAQAWLRAESGNWLAALRRASDAGIHRRVVEVADALHWFSDLWVTWGAWPEVYDRSADAATALGDDRLIAVHEGYRSWAQAVCRRDREAAAAAATRSLEAARRAGDTTQEGWALNYRSFIATHQGDLVAARADAEAAVALMLAAEDREGAPQAMLGLSRVLSRLGLLDEAIAIIRDTVALVADARTRPRAQVAAFTEANARSHLAGALVRAGRWPEVIEAATEAIRLAEPLGVPNILAASYLDRGRASVALGRPEEALGDLEAAVELRRELGNAALLATATEELDRARAEIAAPAGRLPG
ncbi:ATP-binding protein [Cellulomonas pakistanensis]|uniref:HTH cro/C1-type domain-containing protein n=1 Tax=Cellulomonas pakistanensis TaxID=992287 RepID=A0A919P933_9CELL|nr:helix-turn-helix domain-containing protein [Cellulomonas pakistanensis]GIG34684.1 hypothetical protein Cpa01nite_00650 [Cellulomonas pakistanensis]